jgi:EKC/KEOPS complex subunit PCC1/LAGE3
MTNDELKAELKIPFASVEYAQIAFNTLTVDSEPRKELIRKKIELNKQTLIVNWTAKESRILRVSINSFLDHLNSVLETIQQFDTIN